MNAGLLLDNLEAIAAAPGGGDKLRELILQLAVHGRLGTNVSHDNPAIDLVDRIKDEQARIGKGKDSKRRINLDRINANEEPFTIPKNWVWLKLVDLGFTQTGTTPVHGDFESYGKDIPFIKPADIYPNSMNYQNEGLSLIGVEKYGRLAPKNSILMVCIGTIGKCNIISKDCSFNQQINSITPFEPLNAKLILYFLRSAYFQTECWNQSSSTTISILNKGKWQNIPIPLPPLVEQHRIVEKVDRLMSLCDTLEAAIHVRDETLEAFAGAACRSVLDGLAPVAAASLEGGV